MDQVLKTPDQIAYVDILGQIKYAAFIDELEKIAAGGKTLVMKALKGNPNVLVSGIVRKTKIPEHFINETGQKIFKNPALNKLNLD